MSDTNSFSATRAWKKCGDFAETIAFERYGVKTSEKANMHMSTGLPRPGLAHSAHRGQIDLLRGYVSKSSAALNPLTITQVACERELGRGPVRVAWSSPTISGAHAYNNYHAAKQPAMHQQPRRGFAL